MLFEAQLLFSLPATIGANAAILSPFLNLLLLAALIALLYFIFQTNLGRDILGLIGGASLINLFFSPSSREQRYDSNRYFSVFDSPPSTPFFNPPHSHHHGHGSQGYNAPIHTTHVGLIHGHGSQGYNAPIHTTRIHGHG